MRVDPQLEARQIERLRALKDRRSSGSAQRAVDAVREAAKGSANLMPLIVEAVRSEATLGEVADALRDVFGEYRAAS
ncbi:MAG: hypothetical protein RL199_2105 [Pseudomonadota bacterium]|jgi:methylmalonyl-CoA mutase N-terminal domain/subunit